MSQVRDMGRDGQPHFRILDIRNSKILARFLDNLADGWIMDVRNLREKMVFNLEV